MGNMFFVFGINSGSKPIEYVKSILCNRCGKYGRYEVTMTYMCFSLFFIPIFKWNKQYYVKTTCCGTLYTLDPAIGKRIQKGENIEFSEEDLTLIRAGFHNGWSYSNAEKSLHCSNCGFETTEDFIYCPKCGGRLS